MRKYLGIELTPAAERLTSLAAAVLALWAAGCGGGGGEAAQPAPSGSGSASAGMPVPGGGLSVREAVASDLGGPLMVRGFLFEHDGELRLCASIGSSSPPRCAAYPNSLKVKGASFDALARSAPVRHEDGVRWTQGRVSVLGEVADGSIRIAANVKG